MARVPRNLTVRANFAVHKVWRGHNREWNLESHEQKSKYLDLMNQDLESTKYTAGCTVLALTLMSNHTHELFQVQQPRLFSNHMRRHHSRYGAYFNRLKQRCGKVAQDRPHTTLIGDAKHELETTFYIHSNPIRAGIVKDAKNYHWSTYILYAFGKRLPWMRNIRLPDWYKKLGRSPHERQRTYRRLFFRYLRIRGRTKQSFLRRLFFGPTSWEKPLQLAIKSWRNQRPPPPE